MCYVPVQLLYCKTGILIGMTWYFSFWSPALLEFLSIYRFSMSMLIFPTSEPVSCLHQPFQPTPDIVMHNTITSSLLLFELTCPLDSTHHLEQARSRKQNKLEYHQILSELDRLGFTNYYETIEISVLGHYHQFSIKNTYNALHFIYKDLSITKSSVRQMLDDASKLCIAASRRIFMAREWLCPT